MILNEASLIIIYIWCRKKICQIKFWIVLLYMLKMMIMGIEIFSFKIFKTKFEYKIWNRRVEVCNEG